MTGLEITPVGYAMGAKVHGLDLSEPLTDEHLDAIVDACKHHLMLCFPDQNLSREQIVGIGSRLGEVDDNSNMRHRDPKSPNLMMLTNKPVVEGKKEGFRNGDQWHTDLSFRVDPTSYTLLFAQEMPDVGGNTMFANQYMSYDNLSQTFKDIVDDLFGIHLQTKKAASMVVEQYPTVVHPLAPVHPESKQRALFLGQHVRGILGMTPEESQPILDFLSMHATRPEFSYRHAWNKGDFVMWDNRCTLHLAVRDYQLGAGAQPRHILKCSVKGDAVGRRYTDVTGSRYELEVEEQG